MPLKKVAPKYFFHLLTMNIYLPHKTMQLFQIPLVKIEMDNLE